MQDLRNNKNLFGGEFIPDELNACLKSSHLWGHVNTLKLTTNIGIALQNDASAYRLSKQLLELGNRILPVNSVTKCITFPPNLLHISRYRT